MRTVPIKDSEKAKPVAACLKAASTFVHKSAHSRGHRILQPEPGYTCQSHRIPLQTKPYESPPPCSIALQLLNRSAATARSLFPQTKPVPFAPFACSANTFPAQTQPHQVRTACSIRPNQACTPLPNSYRKKTVRQAITLTERTGKPPANRRTSVNDSANRMWRAPRQNGRRTGRRVHRQP